MSKLDHFGMKKIQTICFFIVVLIEAFALIYLHTDLHYNTRICEDMIGLTFVFMSVVQYLWLEQYERLAYIVCIVYFVGMTILLYYAIKPMDYGIFAFNMVVLTNVIIVRRRKIEKERREKIGSESK